MVGGYRRPRFAGMSPQTHPGRNGRHMAAMILLRNAAFYGFLAGVSFAFFPAMLASNFVPAPKWPLARAYLHSILWGLRHICGLDCRVQGLDLLPGSACLIASSQQSTWENMAFPLIFANPAIWIKTELYLVPVAGWIARANDHIPADRGGDLAAAKAGMEKARRQIAEGRSVLIFSEGTRKSVPGQAALKKGTGALYALLERPCAPVVLNSGRYWPHGGLIRPGTITVEVLPPIEPGLQRHDFEQKLKAALDEGTLRLAERAMPDRGC